MKYLLFIVLLVAVLITAGCMSQPQAPTTTISYNVVVPTDTIRTVPTITIQSIQSIPTIAKPIPPVPKPTLIDYTEKSGWVSYTNNNDHFRVYKPSDWMVTEIDKSELPNEGKMDMSLIMDKFVYLYTPNMKGFIMIYGVDYTGTLYSIFDDKEKTQISNDLYDEFVKGIKSSETETIKFTSLVEDSNYYLINGNPARRVTIYSQMNGENLHGDAYLIAKNTRYYILVYSAMAGSTISDESTASSIMRSFTTTT